MNSKDIQSIGGSRGFQKALPNRKIGLSSHFNVSCSCQGRKKQTWGENGIYLFPQFSCTRLLASFYLEKTEDAKTSREVSKKDFYINPGSAHYNFLRTFGKLYNLFVPQLHHIYTGGDISTYLGRLF